LSLFAAVAYSGAVSTDLLVMSALELVDDVQSSRAGLRGTPGGFNRFSGIVFVSLVQIGASAEK
jgi:hypothetical protein